MEDTFLTQTVSVQDGEDLQLCIAIQYKRAGINFTESINSTEYWAILENSNKWFAKVTNKSFNLKIQMK